MLNEEIVKARYGQVYTVPPNVNYVERFTTAQREARENKRGLRQ
jgi:endonuclease YncB( thermonuclease family)